MNKKNGTKICALILLGVFIAQGAGATGQPSLTSKDGLTDDDKQENETQFVDLNGFIRANLFNSTVGLKLNSLVYPTIEMPDSQVLNIDTEQQNDSWVVNATLRIRVYRGNDSDQGWMANKSYIIPRTLTVFMVVIRKNQPLISGAIRDLFLGRGKTKINLFKDNQSDWAEIPLKYTTKTQDESQRVFIIAMGSLLGFISESPPVVIMKTVDISCHYSTAPFDVIPPVTRITLTGDEFEPNFFRGKVAVSFDASDEASDIQETMVQYTTSSPDGSANSSKWLEYTDEPLMLYASGSYAVQYYSVDTAGNKEPMNVKTFEIKM